VFSARTYRSPVPLFRRASSPAAADDARKGLNEPLGTADARHGRRTPPIDLPGRGRLLHVDPDRPAVGTIQGQSQATAIGRGCVKTC
jgi:hypothetical protein